MKIVLFSVLFMLSSIVFSQTIVSTTPSNRRVLFEEFTGKGCPNCPDGHRKVNEVSDANPGKVCAINIHWGSYSAGTPNYTTVFGNEYAVLSGVASFPQAMVNRQQYSGSNLSMSRDYFMPAASVILNDYSPVNVAVQVKSYKEETREMSVLVELYYTSSQENSTNYLNLAIVQNNIIGPQSGSSGNPDYVVGSQYRHMHMLRNMATGYWGVEVEPTTSHSFWDSTFVIVIPEKYGNGNIPVVINDLEFVAFVSDSKKGKVISCANALVPENVGVAKNIKNNTISVFPNPVVESVCMNVNVAENTIGNISVFDFSGKIVYCEPVEFSAGNNSVKLESLSLSKGLYFVKLDVGEESYYSKFGVVK